MNDNLDLNKIEGARTSSMLRVQDGAEKSDDSEITLPKTKFDKYRPTVMKTNK